MKIVRTVSALRRERVRLLGPVVVVTTMGALHEAHLRLMRRARVEAGESGCVVVTIFVNPTQFDDAGDYNRYPRSERTDLEQCRKEGVDLVYIPSPESLYARDHSVYVDETSVSRHLCGASRPGHFRGVCTIVAKLFVLVQPDAAVFGKKDFQQFAVIRRMVRDMNFNVKLIGMATVREKDGLAMSSRNLRLSKQARGQAPVLYAALKEAREAWRGGSEKASALKSLVRRRIRRASLAELDYVEAVDPVTLEPVRIATRGTLLAIAVRFGGVRLIDNLQIQ